MTIKFNLKPSEKEADRLGNRSQQSNTHGIEFKHRHPNQLNSNDKQAMLITSGIPQYLATGIRPGRKTRRHHVVFRRTCRVVHWRHY